MSRGLEIDYETADRITVCCLQDQLRYLKQEIKEHVEEGKYLHPEDYHNSMTRLIPALEVLIDYYGGNL